MKQADILYSSWGYDQTNIDFYEVVKVVGKFCTLQKLASKVTSDGCGAMSGKCEPILGQAAVEYPGQKPVPVKPIKRMVKCGSSHGEYVKIESYASAWVWDGKPKGCSWYA